MLVLSRKFGESILFPSLGIELSVGKVRGSAATLAIKAPPSVKIVRSELLDAAPASNEILVLSGSNTDDQLNSIN